MNRLLSATITVLVAVAPALMGSCATAAAQDDVQARMRRWSTALGVGCTHCHVVDTWADGSKPAHEFARRMDRMVDALNTGPLEGVGAITCWSCHRGQPRPARLPRALWESVQSAHAADFASNPDRSLAMSVYSASLGVECSHCHDAGSWRASAKPAHAMVEKMLPIFDEIPRHFDKSRIPQTQCYMCHHGARTPERQPR